MRIHCDVCEKNLASVMCCTDEAAFCTECDRRIHGANKLADKHVRVALNAAPEPAKCDICQEKRGFFFCLEDRALLCRNCDVSIHTANTLSCNHKRFLVTGTRVALEELKDDPVGPITPEFCPFILSPAASSISQSSHCSHASTLSSPTSTLQGPRTPSSQISNLKTGSVYRAAPDPAPTPANAPVSTFTLEMLPPTHSGNIQDVVETKLSQGFQAPLAPPLISLPSMVVQSTGCMRKSSISEFLTDAVPGWRVDELLNFAECTEGFNTTDFSSTKVDGVTALGGDYDWTADLGLFDEQIFTLHEVPQFSPPAPPAPHIAAPLSRSIRAPRQVMSRSKQDAYLNDAFIVPDIRIPTGPVSQSLPKRLKRDLYHIST